MTHSTSNDDALTVFTDAPTETCETCETCKVSNDDFLAAVFAALPEGARPGIVSFPGNPATVPSK